MDYLIAKLKGRGRSKFVKVLADERIWEFDQAQYTYTAYSPDHNLDGDSWFKIEDFSNQVFCIDFVKREFISAEYNQLPAGSIKDISYLCAVQDSNYFFQKVTPSILLKRKFLNLGNHAEIERGTTKIVINETPDAIYLKNTDTLLFKNLTAISNIFRGIATLYKEATAEETQEFLDEPFIVLKNGYCTDKVGKLNRQRIALAAETLQRLDLPEKRSLFSYIKEYCETLEFNERAESFDIASEDDLKNLLYGIGERFYTTQLGKERRLANSIISLG